MPDVVLNSLYVLSFVSGPHTSIGGVNMGE